MASCEHSVGGGDKDGDFAKPEVASTSIACRQQNIIPVLYIPPKFEPRVEITGGLVRSTGRTEYL